MAARTTSTTLLTVTALILLAAASRLLPHWPNFGPVGAMALFGAAMFRHKWMAIIVPLAALYLSDLALNNLVYGAYYEGLYLGFNVWVYAGFLATVRLGFTLLRGRRGPFRVAGAAVGGSLIFFLLSNFGVWAGASLYPPTFSGLLACYAAGLPFLLNTVAGNLFFAALLFGGAHLLLPKARTAAATERL